jgi:hypothetical protein
MARAPSRAENDADAQALRCAESHEHCCPGGTTSVPVQEPGLFSLPQHSPDLTKMCLSVFVVPSLLVASIILYLLGSRYEHLAEIAEFMLNATLIMSKIT